MGLACFDAVACRGTESAASKPLAEAARDSAIVVIGEVTAITAKPQHDVQVTLKVLRSLKPSAPKTLQFALQTGRSCDLGKSAELGSRWFVLAKRPGERLLTGSHARRLFSVSEEAELVKLFPQAP